MVERQPSKLHTWVRFPSPAPRFGNQDRAIGQCLFSAQKIELLAVLKSGMFVALKDFNPLRQ
jgi:hypothetical protein